MSQEDEAYTVTAILGPAVPWLKTIGAAVLGAFLAAALELALTMLSGGQDPWTGAGLRQLARTGGAAAVVVALAYLKASPLARHEWSEDQRAAERQKLEAQGRLPR